MTHQAPSPTDASPADAATVVAVFVALLCLLPAKVALSRLPMSVSPATTVALALGALWLCTQLTTTLGAAKGRSPVRTALLAHAFVLLLVFWSTSASFVPADERALGDHAMVTAFALIFLGLAVCDGVTSRRRIYFLVRVVVGCACFVSAVGVVQYLGLDLNPYLKPPGTRFTAEDVVVITRSGIPRVSGTTAHPIELGVFCAMVLPLALHLTTLDAPGLVRRTLPWAAVGMLSLGLVFSVSRSAVVAAATAVTVLAIGWPARRRGRMLAAGLAFGVGLWFLAPSIPRTMIDLFLSIGSDSSVRWRTHDYATAWQLVSADPLLGHGIGTWYPPRHEIFDNQYLMSLVSTGVLGLCALVGVMASGVYAAARSIALSHRVPGAPHVDGDRDLAHSLLASLAVVFPTFATFDFMDFSKVASLAVLMVGLAGALLRVVARERSDAVRPLPDRAPPAAASGRGVPRP